MQPEEHPGRTLSIIGLVFAFVSLGVPGLVLSIIGMVQSRRAKQSNIIALLGIIFNSLSIIAGVLFIGLSFLAGINLTQNQAVLQTQALDIKRHADAATLRDVAEAYKNEATSGAYPRADSAGFQEDIASIPGSPFAVDTRITDKLSAYIPNEVQQDVYHIVYCGDRTTANGLKVQYWSTERHSVQALVAGTGCS